MRCQVNEGRLTRVEKVVSDLKEELLRTQQHGMKDNIVFQNLPEVENENVRKTLAVFMDQSLKINHDQINNILIDKAHRMGQKGKYPRSIVAKINDDGRNIIFKHTRNLKGQKASVYTQLPRELAERRKQLVPIFKEARINKKNPKWLGDKLVVGDRTHAVKPDKMLDMNVDTTARACEMGVVRGPPFAKDGSSFQGAKVDVTSPDDITPALHALYANHTTAKATHNIFSYRIKSANGIREYYEDDGEYGAGRRLMELMRQNDITNTLLCVTRWYGDKHMGPVRFKLILDCANEVLQM